MDEQVDRWMVTGGSHCIHTFIFSDVFHPAGDCDGVLRVDQIDSVGSATAGLAVCAATCHSGHTLALGLDFDSSAEALSVSNVGGHC